VRKLAPRTPLVAVVTKMDRVTKNQLAPRLIELSQLADFAEIVPVSSVKGEQVSLLADLLIARLPEGPALYPEGVVTDESDEIRIAELIREAALEGVRDELPHSLAVIIEEMGPREGRSDLIDIYAVVFVERETQKGIVVGHQGARLKDVGTRSRKQIEQLLDSKVFLDLRVKVAKDWQRDPKQMQRLGF
jgi:GTP-binding protein Era